MELHWTIRTADPSLRRFGAALALLPALLLAGCNAVISPAGSAQPVAQIGAPTSESDDPVAAEQHARIVAAYGGIYHDENLEKTLARVVGRLVAASDDPGRSYRITILNAAAINAFALPDGYLYVTRGLLVLANDSSEVAAVIAHEMGHVTANHAAQRQDVARTAALVGRVMTDVITDQDASRQAIASSQRTLAGFSRQQELEADAIGIRTIAKAGYDPFAASRFLASMSRYADYRASLGVVQDKRPDFLASHPNNPERIESARREARQFGAPGLGEVDRERYLRGIDGTVFGDDSEQGFVRGRNFFHARLQVAFTVPNGYVIDNTQQAVLATGRDGTALRFDAVNVDPRMPLADYLSSGWVNGLDPSTIRSFDINGLPAASASSSAKGWEFRIVVARMGSATYRFIFASQSNSAAFDRAASETAASFRRLSAAEAAALRPLKIKVIAVAAGDTPASLAGRMRGVDRPGELFRLLNETDDSQPLVPGTLVKIVTD